MTYSGADGDSDRRLAIGDVEAHVFTGRLGELQQAAQIRSRRGADPRADRLCHIRLLTAREKSCQQ
jgi:hypothetical protein